MIISLFFITGWNHPAAGQDLDPGSGAEPAVLTPLQITASSELEPYHSAIPPYPLFTYYASYVDDWDPDTAWNEGAPGSGTGEYLDLVYPEGTVLTGMLIYPGFYSTDELFYQNNAPTSLKISCGDVTETVSIGSYAEQWQNGFQGMYTDLETPIVCSGPVRVTIESIRTGNTYDDACISELHFYGYTAEQALENGQPEETAKPEQASENGQPEESAEPEPAPESSQSEESSDSEPAPDSSTNDDYTVLLKAAADALQADILGESTVPMDWQIVFTEPYVLEITANQVQTSGVLGCCRADLDGDGEEELLSAFLYGGDKPQLVIVILEFIGGTWQKAAECPLPADAMLFSAIAKSGSACIFCDLSADGCTIWFSGNTGPGLFATGDGTWILAPFVYSGGTITAKSDPYILQGILRDYAQEYLVSGHSEAGYEEAVELVEMLRSINLCPASFEESVCAGFPAAEDTQRCLAIDLSYASETPYEDIITWYRQGIQDAAGAGPFSGTSLIIIRIILPTSAPDISAAQPGEFVPFGTENSDGGTSPLLWQVLDKTDDSLLLITRDVLPAPKYNNTNHPLWGPSAMRAWLNSDFYQQTFNDEEKSRILPTDITYVTGYTENGTWAEETVTDQVFLLNAEQAGQYFADNESRRAAFSGNPGETVPWWLIGIGFEFQGAAEITALGEIDSYGTSVENLLGVRPVIRVRTSDDAGDADDASDAGDAGNTDDAGSAALSEEDLKQLFADAVPDHLLYFIYDDYDYNGTFEAFAVVEQPDNSMYAIAYYVADDGSITRLTQDGELWGYEFQDNVNVRQYYMVDTGTQKFYIWENYAGGSGSQSRIFGVRGGVPYEPQISSDVQAFRQEGGQFISDENDFSQGFHDYIQTTYTFDANTGEFLKD